MGKIRVLRLINRFNLGGPTYNAAYLSRYLGDEFETLLAGGAKDESEGSSEYIVRQLGLEPVIIPEMQRSISLQKDVAAYRKIASIIRAFKPHIVHTHASKAGTLGRLAAYNNHVPVIVHTFHGHVFHSYFNPVATSVFKNIERYLAAKSSAIVTISETQKDEITRIHQICSPDKAVVIPLGFDLDRFTINQPELRTQFRSKYGVAEDEIAVGIIGRLVPVKNHKMFLQAVKACMDNHKKFRVFVIGDGELMNDLTGLCRELQIPFSTPSETPSFLHFTSWITNIEFALAGLDIIALTSFNEGTPVSLIEAQAAGKFIITTRVGGIQDVVVPDKTAFLSDSIDYLPFAEILNRAITEHDQLKINAKLGVDWVQSRFGYSRLCNDMSNLYGQLLKDKAIITG